MSLPGVPQGQNTVSPYLLVPDGAKQIDFLVNAFGAKLEYRLNNDAGAVMHAQVRIGDTVVMLGQSGPHMPAMSAMVHVYVADADATYAAALAAGAAAVRPVEDQFYGDRSGGVRDPAGNVWWIATHVRDVSEAEIAQHMRAKQR